MSFTKCIGLVPSSLFWDGSVLFRSEVLAQNVDALLVCFFKSVILLLKSVSSNAGYHGDMIDILDLQVHQ